MAADLGGEDLDERGQRGLVGDDALGRRAAMSSFTMGLDGVRAREPSRRASQVWRGAAGVLPHRAHHAYAGGVDARHRGNLARRDAKCKHVC
jgi:hypothetical protein